MTKDEPSDLLDSNRGRPLSPLNDWFLLPGPLDSPLKAQCFEMLVMNLQHLSDLDQIPSHFADLLFKRAVQLHGISFSLLRYFGRSNLSGHPCPLTRLDLFSGPNFPEIDDKILALISLFQSTIRTITFTDIQFRDVNVSKRTVDAISALHKLTSLRFDRVRFVQPTCPTHRSLLVFGKILMGLQDFAFTNMANDSDTLLDIIRDYLSKNRRLRWLDIRGTLLDYRKSGLDSLITPCLYGLGISTGKAEDFLFLMHKLLRKNRHIINLSVDGGRNDWRFPTDKNFPVYLPSGLKRLCFKNAAFVNDSLLKRLLLKDDESPTLKDLIYLNLHGTTITRDSLSFLVNFKSLDELILPFETVSSDKTSTFLDPLFKALPNLQIYVEKRPDSPPLFDDRITSLPGDQLPALNLCQF